MPSSSLFLGSCTTLVSVLSLFSSSASAAVGDLYAYSLKQEYSGESFFDGWDFFHQADPNHGFVTYGYSILFQTGTDFIRYVDEVTASRTGLIGFNNGDATMGVDSTHTYNPNSPYYGNNGFGRPSVRISTQQSFNQGLFIADIKHMPGGQCGVWPAFWTLGADGNWPYSGEIDIVEGINNRQYSLAALHTGGQCTIAGDPRTMTGSLQSNNCQYDVSTGANGAGCAVLDTDAKVYGQGLSGNRGAVFAMQWTGDAIKVWSFESGSVPTDITAGTPDPQQWGLPSQIFNGPNCDVSSVIGPQKVIFNTNFCGDFGQAVWASEGCAAQTGYSSCVDYVANNPSAFADAYWQFNYLRYFELGPVPARTVTESSSVVVATTLSSPNSVVSPTTSSPSIVISTTVVTLSTSNSSVVVTTLTATNTVSPVIITPTAFSSNPPITYTLISSTTSNAISPILISTSPTSFSSGPTTLTSAVPESSYVLPAMGSAVTISPAASAGVFAGNWEAYSTTPAEPLSATGTWSEWPAEATTTTIKTTWIEPCETGYTTRTTYIITVHCGCTETPVPTIPMKVVTTTCPPSWGFETPVIMTIPAPPAPVPAWPAWPVEQTSEAPASQTWSVWHPENTPPAEEPTSWNEWVAEPPSPATEIESWSSWSTVQPTASISWPIWSPPGPSSSPSSISVSWPAWTVSVIPVPVPVTSSTVWATWSSTTETPAASSATTSAAGWSDVPDHVKNYTGAAGRVDRSVAVSAAVGVMVMFMALML